MLYHVQGITEPTKQVQQARAVLDFVAHSATPDDGPYALYLCGREQEVREVPRHLLVPRLSRGGEPPRLLPRVRRPRGLLPVSATSAMRRSAMRKRGCRPTLDRFLAGSGPMSPPRAVRRLSLEPDLPAKPALPRRTDDQRRPVARGGSIAPDGGDGSAGEPNTRPAGRFSRAVRHVPRRAAHDRRAPAQGRLFALYRLWPRSAGFEELWAATLELLGRSRGPTRQQYGVRDETASLPHGSARELAHVRPAHRHRARRPALHQRPGTAKRRRAASASSAFAITSPCSRRSTALFFPCWTAVGISPRSSTAWPGKSRRGGGQLKDGGEPMSNRQRFAKPSSRPSSPASSGSPIRPC